MPSRPRPHRSPDPRWDQARRLRYGPAARSRLPFPQHIPTETRRCLTRQHGTWELSGSTPVPRGSSQAPSPREKLTQATKALDGKRNPELFESQNQGSLASLLSHKDHNAFPSAASLPHTCSIFPLSTRGCCSVSWLWREGTRAGHTRGHRGPALAPHVPQRCHRSPPEIPSEALPGVAGLPPAERVLLTGIHASWEKTHPCSLGAVSEFPQDTAGKQQKMQSWLLPTQQMPFPLIHPSPSREFKGSAGGGSYCPSALKSTAPAPRHCPESRPGTKHRARSIWARGRQGRRFPADPSGHSESRRG